MISRNPASCRISAPAAARVWTMDFVHEQLATGRKIRVLTVVDAVSRFSPAIDARFTYRGEDVVRTLAQELAVENALITTPARKAPQAPG